MCGWVWGGGRGSQCTSEARLLGGGGGGVGEGGGGVRGGWRRKGGSGVSRPIGRWAGAVWGIERGRQSGRQSSGSSGGSVSQVYLSISRARVCLLTGGAHCAGSQMRVPAASAAMRDAARCSASGGNAGHDACHEPAQVRGEDARGGGGGGRTLFCACAEGKPRKEAMKDGGGKEGVGGRVRLGGLSGCEGVVGCFVGGPELCPRQVPGGHGRGGAGVQKRPASIDCGRRLVARIGAGRLGAKAACGRLRAHLLVALELTQLLGALASRLVRRAGPLTLGPGVWWGGVGGVGKGRGGRGGV